MIKCVYLWFFASFMISSFAQSQNNPIWFEANSKYLLLINRFSVPSEEKARFNSWTFNYKELQDYRSQLSQELDLGFEKLNELQKTIEEQHLIDNAFFIRINTNSNRVITDAWLAEDIKYLHIKPSGSNVPSVPSDSNVPLVKLLTSPLEHSIFTLGEDNSVITQDPEIKNFLSTNNIRLAHELVLLIHRIKFPQLSAQQYFLIFHNAKKARLAQAKVHDIYLAAWDMATREITDYNVIKFHLDHVYNNFRQFIEYNGENGEIEFRSQNAEDHVEFAFEFFEEISSVTEIEYSNQRAVIEFLKRDSNTDHSDSRKEPIDLLTYYAIKKYKDIDTFNGLSQIARSELTKSSIVAKLDPRALGKILISNHVNLPSNYLVYCNHGHDGLPYPSSNPKRSNLYSNDLYRAADTALWTRLNFNAEAIRLLHSGHKIQIPCGKTKHLLYFSKVVNKVPLSLTGDEPFIVGDDRLVKGVVTFPILNSGSVELKEKIRKAGHFLGYEVKSNSIIENLKEDFLNEIIDTDFYFPVEHTISESDDFFKVGKNSSDKLVLEKTLNHVKTNIILYLPPLDHEDSKLNVFIQKNEMASMFVQRRNLEPQRRLTILNVACESYRCIPVWFRTYQHSFTLPNNPDNAEDEDVVKQELPLVIGSKTSFTSGSADSYESYAVFPLSVIDSALKNAPLKNFIQILSNNQFYPESNIGNPTKIGIPLEAGVESSVLISTLATN